MAEEQKTVVEQVVEDVPEQTSVNPSAPQKQQSVAEKKARKVMQKKGFEQVTGITNISVIRKRSAMFSIYSPDVYKNAGSDTWIVFGEARVDNLNRSMNPGAQSAMRAAAGAGASAAPVAAPAAAVTEVKAADEADEAGVASQDIELVVAQAGCTRAEAVKALKDSSNDVVNAIMELTMK
ncbi:hypothetical protein GGH12_001928 [Coemansia sp. RSA 1822]|nr:hypothetical protein LPJ76_002778 [Coemansia sp. RSA 638]KAJ2121241.1 hypothetical protein IW147_004406 [Coemansia sp. RSA 720]KAJ2474599.1 hypothetical protein IWW56_005804 [Coemansia sp. RSA 2131]KAJ2545155.1 hypothetical protein GGF49_000588 [Coemansia sp. RSA 1853]KAJ2564487.1 hypothetical protein GGH12_001928 [Coemansia sp. RSA 1822]